MAGFDLSKIKEKSLRADVRFAGEKLEFEFVPGKLNEEWYRKQEKAGDDEDLRGLVECVTDVMTSWNVMNGDGKAVPIDPEKIMALDLPLPLFGMLNTEIQRVAQDGGESTKKAR